MLYLEGVREKYFGLSNSYFLGLIQIINRNQRRFDFNLYRRYVHDTYNRIGLIY